jgi:hypothetical protein
MQEFIRKAGQGFGFDTVGGAYMKPHKSMI